MALECLLLKDKEFAIKLVLLRPFYTVNSMKTYCKMAAGILDLVICS